MNTSLIRFLVAFAWLTAFGQGAFAAVTFTVTPTAVSNTYPGTISLVITGLTNKTVVIQKFLDLNTNGVIDGGDILVQQFTLKDGTNFVIGGVTNFNVPGDLSATFVSGQTGAITATLNFQSGDFMQNVVGNYLYVLSQTKGGFTPITNSFSVTNFPFLQTFTGNVVSNGTSTTVSNTVVLLFPPPVPGHNGPSGPPLAGVVANNAGSYTVQMPPGTYVPVAFRSNYVANYTASPVLMLTNNQTITTNLTLTIATASISGSVVDASNSNIGLPGVLVPAMSTDGLIAVAFTDTNGNFNVPVTAGTWEIQVSDKSLIVLGYVGLNNGTNVNAGTTGVTLAVPEATALIYGSVTDNLGNPLAGVDVEADDNNNLYDMDGFTDTNGNYVIAVLGGLGSGDPWSVQANGNNQLTNYVFSQQNIDGNISAGTAVLQNFTAILATNYISGSLNDNSNNPIAGVGVWASATINGVNYNLGSVDTDTNGNYSLNVANGTWSVGVNSGGGNPPYVYPPSPSVVISNNNATVNFIGILATNNITGNVKFNGTNLVGVGVWASATISGVYYQLESVDTDANGNYSLNVANGNWTVALFTSVYSDSLDSILGSGNYQYPGNQNVAIDNNNGTANFAVQPCGVTITTTSGSWLGNQFQFLLNGMVGQNYTIQMSTNLSSTNWTSLFITNNAATNSFNVIDLNATNKQRFYRVLVGP